MTSVSEGEKISPTSWAMKAVAGSLDRRKTVGGTLPHYDGSSRSQVRLSLLFWISRSSKWSDVTHGDKWEFSGFRIDNKLSLE
jgi:hypothetical protein